MAHIDPARLVIAGFRGSPLPSDYEARLRAGSLGGIILFSRNFEDAAQAHAIVAQAREAQPQMIASVDQEGGRVERLKELSLPPANRWQQYGDPELVRRAAASLGRFLGAIGFNMNFAPVVDVNTNPDNPVIGDRAFGDDVITVRDFARPFAEGLHSAGVASCAKHFPGHGDTDVDSHLALPRLAHEMERLERIELASFANFVDLPAWMTAHILFGALDDLYPATLSESVMRLARSKLGFDGVLISDDLEMNAVASHHGYAEAAVRAISVGCDAVLICSDASALEEASVALRREAKKSAAFRERVDQAWNRLARLIDRFPMPETTRGAWRDVVRSEEVQWLRERLADLDESDLDERAQT